MKEKTREEILKSLEAKAEYCHFAAARYRRLLKRLTEEKTEK